MRIRQLDIGRAEYIAHRYAAERLNFEGEPMPPFQARDPGKLESCLLEPFQTFGGKPLHRTFYEKAAVLFYLITKNHCFSNGNKRMAVTLTMVFFFINKRWLSMPEIELYKIANTVAKSRPSEREDIQKMLVDLFKKYAGPLDS